MDNERYQEIIDEAYENYLKNFVKPICPPNLDVQPSYYDPMTKDWFVKSAKARELLISKLLKISQEINRKPKANYINLSEEYIQTKADENGVTFEEMIKIIEIEYKSV